MQICRSAVLADRCLKCLRAVLLASPLSSEPSICAAVMCRSTSVGDLNLASRPSLRSSQHVEYMFNDCDLEVLASLGRVLVQQDATVSEIEWNVIQ